MSDTAAMTQAVVVQASSPRAGAHPWVTLSLLSVGLVIGAIVALTTAPVTRTNPYASLPATAEPEAGQVVAQALLTDDARLLAHALDAQLLQALSEAMQPIATIFEVRFLGAVERGGEILAAYGLEGRDRSGMDVAVGYVLRVVDNKVVGVN